MNFSADPETAYSMVIDPEYARLRAERTLGTDVEIDISGDPATVISRRTLPVPDELPSFAKGMVGNGIRVEETHSWKQAAADGTRTAELTLMFPSMPVRAQGSITISPAPEGCAVTIEATATASMPMVGAVIEQGVKAAILSATKQEQELGVEWLSR